MRAGSAARLRRQEPGFPAPDEDLGQDWPGPRRTYRDAMPEPFEPGSQREPTLPQRPAVLLLDIDGVLVVSWRALPGAVDTLSTIRAAGTHVRLLTNTTSRPRSSVVAALRSAGLEVPGDDVVTAPIATAEYLRAHFEGATAALLCSGDVTDDLATSGVELVDLAGPGSPGHADVVVLGGAGPEFSYQSLNRALDLVLGGAALVAMHRALVWRTSEGIQLDTGAFLAGLEHASGVSATVVGKPEPGMFAAGLADLGVGAGETVMIGDDIDSDVRGAQAAGLHGILVRTGKFRPQVLDTQGSAPDLVTDSIASAAAALGYDVRAG